MPIPWYYGKDIQNDTEYASTTTSSAETTEAQTFEEEIVGILIEDIEPEVLFRFLRKVCKVKQNQLYRICNVFETLRPTTNERQKEIRDTSQQLICNGHICMQAWQRGQQLAQLPLPEIAHTIDAAPRSGDMSVQRGIGVVEVRVAACAEV